MSIRIMTAVWEMALSPVEKLVLLAVADCANDEGLAWPSIATIQRKTNVGERTVQRSLRALEQMGVIERTEVVGKGCKYIVHPRHSGTPVTQAPVPQSAQTPATVAPKPSRTITPKKQTAHVIATDWQPLPFAKGSKCSEVISGWPAGELETQIEHFTAHHRAKGSRFVDWQDAWKTWVLNSRKWGVRPAAVRQAHNDPGDFLAHLSKRGGP